MVVFTCYHCGDSLQKPKVDKHINIECKKKFLNPRLTCVDCFVDFDGKTFVEHTKCVTEEQRYSGKGFVPKPSSNKGEKKQQSWFDIIQVVSKKPRLQESHRKLLKLLCNYPNVPRKQSKFNNFINASLKHARVNANIIDEVFKLIDDEFRLNSEIKQVENNDSKSQQANKSEHGDTVVVPSSDNSPEKKIEKDKLTDIENTNNIKESSAVNENVDENASFEVVRKKKKSKKDNVENEVINVKVEKPENDALLNKNLKRPLENSFEEDISVKSISKKKRKKLKLQEIQPSSSNDDTQIDLTQNDSKDTTVDLTHSEDFKTLNGVSSQENLSKKERKEKKKRQNGSTEFEPVEVASEVLPSSVEVKSSDNIESVENLSKKSKKEKKNKLKCETELKTNLENGAAEPKPNEAISSVEIKSSDNVESVENLGKKEKKKKKKLPRETDPKDEFQVNSAQNGFTELELEEPTPEVTPVEGTKSVDNAEPVENLSRKEKKERKKKLKYEAELKAIEAEVVQSHQPGINNQENETDKNEKREKKKKRKLNEITNSEEVENKRTKLAESEPCENVQSDLKKFDWEEVIRTVLEKADGKQISLKKLSKKVVTEYQSCHSEATSHDSVLRKFNKKIMKLPFVQVAKDRAILIT